MKHPFRCHILPFFTMVTGGLGLALRLWLFSAADEQGLLPKGHFADAALYILTALVLGILFLATRELAPRRISRQFMALSGAGGCLLGALGLLIHVLPNLSGGSRLAILTTAAGFLGCLALAAMALLKYLRKRTPYWIVAVLTFSLMLTTVSQCQVWGAEPQLQAYCFPLMASVFLILTAYQQTRREAKQGDPRLLVFFSQGALFLCCLSLNSPQCPLYLGMLFWSAVQLYPCIRMKKEA